MDDHLRIAALTLAVRCLIFMLHTTKRTHFTDFAWLGHFRWLHQDDEQLPAAEKAWIVAAMTQLMEHRSPNDPFFDTLSSSGAAPERQGPPLRWPP
jgi:hypothetical protein